MKFVASDKKEDEKDIKLENAPAKFNTFNIKETKTPSEWWEEEFNEQDKANERQCQTCGRLAYAANQIIIRGKDKPEIKTQSGAEKKKFRDELAAHRLMLILYLNFFCI